MHVLYVSLTYPPDNGWGGIGTYTFHAARGMRSLGHEVTVLCQAKNKPFDRFDDDGIRTISRQLPIVSQDKRDQIRTEVEQIVRTLEPDVIEAAEYGADLLAFQRANPKFPVVIRLHVGTQLCAIGGTNWWKRAARMILPSSAVMQEDGGERETVHRSHGVTSCCSWLIEEYKKRNWILPTNTKVIYNPISIYDKSLADKDYDSETILSLGRLDMRKGADLLPSIIHQVLGSRPRATFTIAGQDMGGSPSASWQSWISGRLPAAFKDRVQFLGGVSPIDVPDVLSAHNTAFFASTLEGFPYSHIEAMQHGLACVIASGGGARELGKDSESTVFVPRKPGAIASALVDLLRSPDRKRSIGISAAAYVKQELNPRSNAASSAEFYEDAIDLAKRDYKCSTIPG